MKSTHCLVCNKIFTPKYHGRDKVCCFECRNILISRKKQKYSSEQIDQVIALKKNGETNSKINEITGVKLSKIKEIVKENNLFLDRETINKNAYNGKLKKNPNAMKDMRAKYCKLAQSEESLEEVKKYLLENGYEYVKGFKSKSKPFTVRCLTCKKEKKIHKINTIVKGACMYCSGCSRTSKTEKEIREWISSLGIHCDKFKFKERKDGIEIDVYVPSAKLGIEYCGLYWHNENSPTPRLRDYHLKKMLKANKEGIRLITVFEDEWRDRKAQVKNFLKSILNINEVRVFARKCECKQIDNNIANSFLKETHIQGSGKTIVSFGLFYNDNLVGVITGGHHHRNEDSSVLILNRLAFKEGYQIVGGSSKLLKNLTDYAKTNNYSKIISWSDNRWSEGNVYKKMGFMLEKELGPDYSYVKGASRIDKQSCQKKKLLKENAVGNTETEMAHSLNYYKIWDCGKKRWAKSLLQLAN
jgi:hypothetical protein